MLLCSEQIASKSGIYLQRLSRALQGEKPFEYIDLFVICTPGTLVSVNISNCMPIMEYLGYSAYIVSKRAGMQQKC